jgi:tetratricopeptide (TPR) repeat protein
VKRDNLAYLLSGLFYGALIGFGIFYLFEHRPGSGSAQPAAAAQAPAAPRAPGQPGPAAAASGAPMMEEISALKQMLEENPGNPQILTRLANIYHDVQMWPQAIDYYQRSLEVVPDNPNLMTDMGICYRGMRQFDEALEMFEKAHEADPQHWRSLFNIVVVAGFDLGDLDRAESALAHLREVNPSAPNLDRLQSDLQHARERLAAGGPS